MLANGLALAITEGGLAKVSLTVRETRTVGNFDTYIYTEYKYTEYNIIIIYIV